MCRGDRCAYMCPCTRITCPSRHPSLHNATAAKLGHATEIIIDWTSWEYCDLWFANGKPEKILNAYSQPDCPDFKWRTFNERTKVCAACNQRCRPCKDWVEPEEKPHVSARRAPPPPSRGTGKGKEKAAVNRAAGPSSSAAASSPLRPPATSPLRLATGPPSAAGASSSSRSATGMYHSAGAPRTATRFAIPQVHNVAEPVSRGSWKGKGKEVEKEDATYGAPMSSVYPPLPSPRPMFTDLADKFKEIRRQEAMKAVSSNQRIKDLAERITKINEENKDATPWKRLQKYAEAARNQKLEDQKKADKKKEKEKR